MRCWPSETPSPTTRSPISDRVASLPWGSLWLAAWLLALGCACGGPSPGGGGSDPDATGDVVVTPDASDAEITPPDVMGVDVLDVADGGVPAEWTQIVADGDWMWLSRHDGVVAGAHVYPNTPVEYYEYTRFEVFQPFELRSVRVTPSVQQDESMTVYVWDDLGGNFLHMDPDHVLASWTRDVTTADGGVPFEYTLETPIRVDPGRMFYVGTIVNGELGSRIAIDAAMSEVEGDKSSPSLVWLSKDLEPTTNTYTVFAQAGGDYLVDVEVKHVDVVQDDGFFFEPWDMEGTGLTGGVSLIDVDDDGDLDAASGLTLLINDGTGHYGAVDGGVMPEGVGGRGHWADFDNDGDQDLLLTGKDDYLLRNDDGVFVDITAEAGIDDTQEHTCSGETTVGHVPTETATWIDYNSDGLMDVYLGNFICWEDGFAAKDMLFENQGDGTFVDVSAQAGLYLYQGYGQAARGTAPADYDNDGDMDLLVANYRLHRNLMWRNMGDGTLVDAGAQSALAGTSIGGAYGHSIGASWGDFDHDGDLDVFIANLAHPRFLAFSDKQRLYRNDGSPDPGFEDITEEVGIRYQETPSGPVAWDYDNDGDLDLTWTCVYAHRPTQFYRNDWPTGAWTEVTYPSGLVVHAGWHATAGDMDDDGDLDFLSNGIFANRNPWGRKSIQVRPRGRGQGSTNRDGFGARVTVLVDGVERMQEKAPSHGISNQQSPWLHFGIGQADGADVTVSFPLSGESYTFEALDAGRYTVDEDGNLTVER